MTGTGGLGMADEKRGISPKVILFGVLAVVLVVFAVLNTDDAKVNWILGTWETSLIVVILLSGAIGFALGFLVRSSRNND
jgi:uncharacterized integral membrane protein